MLESNYRPQSFPLMGCLFSSSKKKKKKKEPTYSQGKQTSTCQHFHFLYLGTPLYKKFRRKTWDSTVSNIASQLQHLPSWFRLLCTFLLSFAIQNKVTFDFIRVRFTILRGSLSSRAKPNKLAFARFLCSAPSRHKETRLSSTSE